ncbi:TnsA-like heteromeric transposase endonuclease subunit [Luteipulveratus halotolerans]|uniref:TnsA-like heteromeric transposase endonuclease subunit n=1 Tax=Luteipulveratus halotolerans TaxID=1631356 RepID=UPI0038B3B031
MTGLPVRRLGSRAGQRNYSGWLWCATTDSLVGYESLLERDRLWLADFEPSVCRIASQPVWCSGKDQGSLRRHAPDFMLEYADGSHLVVDVKPAALLDEPRWSTSSGGPGAFAKPVDGDTRSGPARQGFTCGTSASSGQDAALSASRRKSCVLHAPSLQRAEPSTRFNHS